MATFTVVNLNDSGAGSLRAAIEASNAEPAGTTNTIEFTVTGTIVLASGLPSLIKPVDIVAGNPATGNPPTVGIDFNGNAGLVFAAGSEGSELVGLSLGNANGNGVTLHAGGITLNNNYIGLALNGSAAGNTGDGVFVAATSSGNNLGFNPEAATLAENGQPATGVVSNVISANGGNGITLNGADNNEIVSNRIGTSTDGNTAMANGGHGIWLTNGATGNTIGGAIAGNDASGDQNNPTGNKGNIADVVVVTPPLGNLVSGNGGNGIQIDTASNSNTLSGNFVGTTANGLAALGNNGDGVAILESDSVTLSGCVFVDNPFIYYNVIGGNAGNGVHVTNSDNVVIQANFLGLGADNNTIVGNQLDGLLIDGSSRNTQVGGVIPLGNVISGNVQNGIEVAGTASGFSTLNTFGGTTAFFGAAPNGANGILITSTGGNQTIQTNVISGNTGNGIEIAGNAWGVSIVPNIVGLDTRGDGAFPNGGSGIVFSGNAHDNFVGGTDLIGNLSVIRQNTVSGNAGYGIEITGTAYNNVIADSAIGTNIQELAAIANGLGGVLVSSTGVGNIVGSPLVGWTPLPSPAVSHNVISGNTGPGVTLAAGTNYNAVINNYIGLNIVAQPVLPNGDPAILNNGGTNLIYGNGAHGPLPWQSPTGQLEALYVGWFGRAADPLAFRQDMEGVLSLMLGGDSIAAAMLKASDSFAASPEIGIYTPLAALTPPISSPTHAETELTNSFINQTFNNLFGRDASTSEKTIWREAFFQGAIPFADLVYDIASSAQNNDVVAMNAKILAASYFTTAFASTPLDPPSLAEMQAAISGVTNGTTLFNSQAATDALMGGTHTQVEYQSILEPGNITTGVRASLDGTVILTGNKIVEGSTGTEAFLYHGPLNNTAAGQFHVLDPTFAGQTVTTATFYGPDTAIFTPGIGLGNVRAVGSYQYAENPAGVFNHGMIYEGPITGIGGTWTEVTVPSNGVNVVGGVTLSGTVANTILHSTQGNLVVGNYDISGPGGILLGANGFIYNIATGQYTLMNVNGSYDNLTSLYGIWQNGVGSNTYTIAGGSKDGTGVNAAFLQTYDASTGEFSNLTFYNGFNKAGGLLTHFENITAVPGGFNLVATTDSGPAFAAITLNTDGTFGEAVWTAIQLPGSELLTGNIAFQNVVGGIYNTDSVDNVATYLGVVQQSYVDASGGLIMPVGSHDFSYSLSVRGSIGATITGSTTAGNVLGGSIGNDTITGTLSLVLADTIYTGGGADTIILAAGHTASSRIQLFAGNSLTNADALQPGASVSPITGSIVDANDIPQLGWWGQATGQLGGPVSNASTNGGMGTGTSADMTTVQNFVVGTGGSGDTIDISLAAFSNLIRAADGDAPRPGAAIFSNIVGPGGTITVDDATIIRIESPGGFVGAADLAAALEANPITFAGPQDGALNHYLVAYQDTGGNVRIADMSIQSGGGSFTDTAGGATLAISDMAQLQGVTLSSLQTSNVSLLAGTAVENSSYLDFTGWRINDATSVMDAYGLAASDVSEATFAGLNVALILDRATDPTALLAQDWGTRQQTLAEMNDAGTLWTTYGADQTLYNSVVEQLKTTYGLTILDGTNSANKGDYVSSAESRTIWVELNTAEQFASLFGTTLYQSTQEDNEFVFWNGDLLLPEEWDIQGLWFDTENVPPPSNMTPGVSTTLQQGSQSPGNNSSLGLTLSPQQISELYNFPLAGLNVETGAIGLIEPGIGSALHPSQTKTFQELLTEYLASVGQTGNGAVSVQGENGQTYNSGSGERSLDVGVVASVNPNSDIYLFNGSGYNGNADASTFTAIQSALWDPTLTAAVLSSSFGDDQSMSPNSPFYAAYRQLQLDAALKNVSLFNALGDGGSGNETGNGLTNLAYNETSPYNVMVGGTSFSTFNAAQNDQTLNPSLVAPALANDQATLWRLMAGGLTALPQNLAALQTFAETVWNQYFVVGNHITIGNSPFEGGYLVNTTTSGGVDPTQPIPDYQLAYGLRPVSSDPSAQTGRGAPDVSANAGGNLSYLTPNSDMVGTGPDGGTSAATPLWASLGVQLNTIFADQGLPNLGYMNDLLYMASAIAPAAFNDITMGNNTSSFTMGGSYITNGTAVTPTGFGYSAIPGYDLATGLGSPNGVLLARALTTIAHSQVSYADSPDMLDVAGDGWASGANQSLLFQTMTAGSAAVGLDLGGTSLDFLSGASSTYAWTARLAQQSLQSDFDPALVRLFDKAGQGAVTQASVTAGESVGVSINASEADAIQGSLSSPFGFADFVTGTSAVRVARPVAVAETVNGLDDQVAVVRVRQNGEDKLSLSLYRVDDLSGTIGGLAPGEAGYAAAAQGRVYQFTSGGTALAGPGYGNYAQAGLANVDSGDLIAMQLTNQTSGSTFWAFSQANESVGGQNVNHIWNYGLNTWGWEDVRGGGDHDYNDLLVQLDFTSNYGNGWLV
jgi:hypothetical protein